MPDVASEVRAGLDNLADAVRMHAGVIASLAASRLANTEGRQREMAAVILQDAKQQFGDVLRRVNKADRDKMHRYIDGLCRGPKK
jgi:hypothetical protein